MSNECLGGVRVDITVHIWRCECVCVCVTVRPSCCSLSWGEAEAQQFADVHGDFDLLLGADVVFWPDAIPLLIQTVACFLTRRVCHTTLSAVHSWVTSQACGSSALC